MAGVSLTFILSNFILLIGLSEFYYTLYLTPSNRLGTQGSLILKNNTTLLNTNINTVIYYLFIQLVAVLSCKLDVFAYNYQVISLYFYNFYVILLVCGILFYIKTYYSNNITYILLVWLVALLNFFYFVTNFLILILMLELVATIYYFFFLNNLVNNSQTVLKLKNLLVNYLWLSLFTLMFFSLMLFIIIHSVGTLDFFELNLLYSAINAWGALFLFISLMWKLGLPGFHFFKFELYQYLSLDTIFYFSVFSIVINSYILFFVLQNILFFTTTLNTMVFIIIIIINSIMLLRGVESLKFFQFLALSGLNTLTTILIFSLA